MEAIVVRAADEVAHRGSSAVGNNWDYSHTSNIRNSSSDCCNRVGCLFGRHIHRADIAGAAVHVAMYLVLAGETELAQHLGSLDLVELVVAAQQQQHEFVLMRHHGD